MEGWPEPGKMKKGRAKVGVVKTRRAAASVDRSMAVGDCVRIGGSGYARGQLRSQ